MRVAHDREINGSEAARRGAEGRRGRRCGEPTSQHQHGTCRKSASRASFAGGPGSAAMETRALRPRRAVARVCLTGNLHSW